MPYKKLDFEITKEMLEEMYLRKGMSTSEIAQAIGVHRTTVFYNLNKFGIETRTLKDGAIQRVIRGRKYSHRSGKDSPNWRGGRRITERGYVDIWMPEHQKARRNGYVTEHILVWEKQNGEIPKGFHIHHKNGNKQDNRIENLECMDGKDHLRLIPKKLEMIRQLEDENSKLKQRVEFLEAELEKLRKA